MKRYILYFLPILFLILFLFKIPFYVPSFLLKTRIFFAYDRQTDTEILYHYLKEYKTLNLLAGGDIHPLRHADFSSIDDLQLSLERMKCSDFTVLSSYIHNIVSQVPPLSKVFIVLNYAPHSQDIEALQSIQYELNIPVNIKVEKKPYRPIFMGYSYTCSLEENALSFELLFSKDIHSFDTIRVSKNGNPYEQLSPQELYLGTTFKTTLPADEDTVLRFDLNQGNYNASRLIHLKGQNNEEPSILLISSREKAVSYLETNYSVKKIPLAQAVHENLYKYPLIVFDGIPIKMYGSELSSILVDIYEKRSSSIFFISDSPAFGKKGDNSMIEGILPCKLSPRSLKYLPDLGILIYLDISSSMMGEKLSLAKVSTLELVKNLKSSDIVSLLTFWDQYRYLYGFEEMKNINTEVSISPLIARGGTDLYRALEDGLERLIKLDMDQKHIIILTDGNTKEAEFDELIKRSLLEQISISCLAVGEDINVELLRRLSEKTGGNYYRVHSLDEIPSIIFEDRKDISRSAFGLDRFSIYDYSDEAVSEITGMSLYAPKNERSVLYRNQFEDPLFLLEKRNKQLILMLLSDIYGYYTGDFFSKKSVLRTLNTTLDSILSESSIKLRLGEASRHLSFTLAGERLIRPRIAVYYNNRLIMESVLTAGAFNTFSTLMPLPYKGEYTALIYCSGSSTCRFPFYFNGTMEGLDTESILELRRFRISPFKKLHSPIFYLFLFFLSSLYITYSSRKSFYRGFRP